MASEEIWRVRVNDGTAHYFISRFEADFFAKDTAEAGFSVSTAPVPLPETPRDFISFMERVEEERRHAETLLAQIEKVTPNWRAYRSLAEAVEVAIHHGSQSALARHGEIQPDQ